MAGMTCSFRHRPFAKRVAQSWRGSARRYISLPAYPSDRRVSYPNSNHRFLGREQMLDRIFLDIGAGREAENMAQNEGGATIVIEDFARLVPHG